MITIQIEKRMNKSDVLSTYPGHEIAEEHYHSDGHFIVLRTPEEIEEIKRANIRNKLQEVDASSIRAIREYIINQANSPKKLKDLEEQAEKHRKTLRGL